MPLLAARGGDARRLLHMDNKELWTATAFLLAGIGFTMTGWQTLWVSVPMWSFAGLVLLWVWRDDIWEWQQSLRRKPRWTLTPAQAVLSQDGLMTLGLYVANPQRDGEFYGRVEETRGLKVTPRPPWDLRWRSARSRHEIGFKDRDIVDVMRFEPKKAPELVRIPFADPSKRSPEDAFADVEVDGDFADVAFRLVIRRKNRRAVLERWVKVTRPSPREFIFEVLSEGEEPE